jgi:hypothetical protein
MSRTAATRVLRNGLIAGSIGGVVGGAPSTLHAIATGRDPLEATLAAGAIVLPHERRAVRLLAAAAVIHGSLSLGWGLVLAVGLPRRSGVFLGSVAGLAIAALDLGIVGRRIPQVRRLPLWPQVADHMVYGAVVGAVLRRRTEGTEIAGSVPSIPRVP